MNRITRAALTTVLAIFTSQAHSETDLFSGVYRPAMPNQTGSFAVEPISQGKWNISSNEVEGEPFKPFPTTGAPPMVLAAHETIDRWFDETSPHGKISCLAPEGSDRIAFSICHVPTDSSYQVRESISNKRESSATGYIFVTGTFAGVMTGDLVRSSQ